ncbi:MBL fold metallo-hydrolase [Microbacterium foliorum]|uniref:Metallo-beta-lactamase superfamily protein n=1 Tax=Microbacterium foliorum TaxID=104336 RepID=A0A0F0KMV9_9MICO|nr:MBL fold metallo-hydrolase [Microbacterium foliorum]AXL10738.1 MBL fold metallo-hydrolase [Microbacterium foliorum]KJL21774.1 Metallo-beta-lactamase superfamily protein [Microbacterium foliorum]
MYMRVLNVGDGACSVFTKPWDQKHLIVDCGATPSGRGEESAQILSSALGTSSSAIEAVLITHFDADHWAGIKAFPSVWEEAPKEVTLYYPHLLPRRVGAVQAAHLLFQAARAGASITPVSEIIDEWRAKGVVVHPVTVSRGRKFTAAGAEWDVHWPPADVGSFRDVTRRGMESLEDEIDDLVRRHPSFREALYAVYEDWEAGVDRQQDVEVEFELQGDRALKPAADVIDGLGLDDESVLRLSHRLSKYTNLLSVVHSTSTVVNFGDCGGAGLNALLRLQRDATVTPRLAESYRVVLAPHHGTHRPGATTQSLFPGASHVLVSQNGAGHLATALRTPKTMAFKRLVGGALGSGSGIDIHEHGHLYLSV